MILANPPIFMKLSGSQIDACTGMLANKKTWFAVCQEFFSDFHKKVGGYFLVRRSSVNLLMENNRSN
jgi:hypothetical protein